MSHIGSMKAFKEVLKDQAKYHQSPNVNTVHRSSLLIPVIPDHDASISFLNHFLIKRGYKNVSLKVTPYGKNGSPLPSNTYVINEPRVYSLNLSSEFNNSEVSSYQAEFFCAENLFIPFPAVMVNHSGAQGVNICHSYNRVLNDLTEFSKVSAISVKESSFEFVNNSLYSTFVVFHTGLQGITPKDNLEFELLDQSGDVVWNRSLDAMLFNSPMTSYFINLHAAFDDLPVAEHKAQYTVKVKQPEQFMFYGRLLAGIAAKENSAISANHSYYDSSASEEYFDGVQVFRTYPYSQDGSNTIVLYPISSHTSGIVRLVANHGSFPNVESTLLLEEDYNSSGKVIYLSVDQLVSLKGLDNVKTFSLLYDATDGKGAPTRLNHQLCYGSNKEGLSSSINVTLHSLDVPVYEKKIYVSWIQALNDPDYDTYTSICFSDAGNQSAFEQSDLRISYFDSTGLLLEQFIKLSPLDSVLLEGAKGLSRDKYLWITAESSDRGGFDLYTYHCHKVTGHCSGEHGF